MAFSILSCLDPSSLSAAPQKQQPVQRISYYDLVPSANNFYSMEDIEELKAAIELAGHVLHNLVVTPLSDGKYRILSGHRRHRAVGELLKEGKDQYEFLPCAVEDMPDDGTGLVGQTLLIAANSQREKTAWDKLEEVRQMREIARRAKDQDGLPGRVRDLVAKSLHVSSSRIAKYDSILNNLNPELMDEIKAGCLPISTAYELSTLDSREQLCQYAFFREHGKLPEKAVQSDVFQGNTQSDAVQSDKPAQPNVFQGNTLQEVAQTEKPTHSDVFDRNTQPVTTQLDESAQRDACSSGTHQTIPRDFEEYLRGVDLTEDEIGFFNWIAEWDCRTIKNMQSVLRKVRNMPVILPPVKAGTANGADYPLCRMAGKSRIC